MQKTLRFLIAVVAMAGLASCASDEPVVPADGDAEHFSISIPSDVISRGFADGSSAKNIYVAVYPADDNSAVPCISNFKSHPVNNELVGGSAKVTDRTADMSITLVKGKSYNVFFLAESYLDNAEIARILSTLLSAPSPSITRRWSATAMLRTHSIITGR